MADGPVLDIRGLTVRLPPGADRANAVEDVSLMVRRGEIVCIVGESGSGKSVTNLSVMRLIPYPPGKVVGGRILFDGVDLSTVQQLAGHASVATTARYDRCGEATKRRAVAALHFPYRGERG